MLYLNQLLQIKELAARTKLDEQKPVFFIVHPECYYQLQVTKARCDHYSRSRKKRILKNPHRYLFGKIREFFRK